jgi:hypothetical protein
MCILEAFGLGRDGSGDIIPLLLPSMLFFAVTEYEPICLHFSVRNRYVPSFHARIFGQLRLMFFSDVSSCALSCRFMIRECSAGPHMISRLERKPLLVRGSVSLFFMQSLPLYNDLHTRYMLGTSACQHIWIIVMCSIRAEMCFIHICHQNHQVYPCPC